MNSIKRVELNNLELYSWSLSTIFWHAGYADITIWVKLQLGYINIRYIISTLPLLRYSTFHHNIGKTHRARNKTKQGIYYVLISLWSLMLHQWCSQSLLDVILSDKVPNQTGWWGTTGDPKTDRSASKLIWKRKININASYFCSKLRCTCTVSVGCFFYHEWPRLS